ncbi:MAG: hypothetical protein GF313_00270 [Caldithrix sp.]|nr:hypothetical protein [Caldithrix sp.]
MNHLINLELYTPLEFFFYFTGFFLWGVLYVILMRNIIKYKFVEMPFIVAAGNIAWELLYSFVFEMDMGYLLTWLYRIGTLVDVFIFIMVLRYGHKQITHLKGVEKYFRPMVVLIFLGWGILFYFYRSQGLDNSLGTISAIQLNMVISALYIVLILSRPTLYGMSYAIAWLKMLGTGLVTVFLFLHFPDNHFIQTMGIFVFIVDNIYIYMFAQRRKAEKKIA